MGPNYSITIGETHKCRKCGVKSSGGVSFCTSGFMSGPYCHTCVNRIVVKILDQYDCGIVEPIVRDDNCDEDASP